MNMERKNTKTEGQANMQKLKQGTGPLSKSYRVCFLFCSRLTEWQNTRRHAPVLVLSKGGCECFPKNPEAEADDRQAARQVSHSTCPEANED